MTDKAIVAVHETTPETVLHDIRTTMNEADFQEYLDPSKTVILKDNISWHFPFLGANTTPWQLEGVILALKDAGYDDIVCVQNETVVTPCRFAGDRWQVQELTAVTALDLTRRFLLKKTEPTRKKTL